MATNKTFVLLKPDAVQRRLVGEIIGRFEAKGFVVEKMQMMTVTRETAETHYGEHKGKSFYDDLVSFITGGPSVALCLSGDSVVPVVRKMMGATKFMDAEPGTIRGDYAHDMTANLVHGSDSPESAERELGIFFGS
ncbi:MAG: nucleoside-diphosphate kinase [Planctomycetota bacterium]